MDSCKGFYIDNPQTGYYTEDGVLFGNRTLITYPQGNEKEPLIGFHMVRKKLERLAFTNTPYLQTVYIPETMTKLDSQMFYNDSSRSVHMKTHYIFIFLQQEKP